MDQSDPYPIVYFICADRSTVVDCLHSERWIHAKRSTPVGRRTICADIGATLYLAHIATYASFYETDSPKANHTNFMDGAHLLGQCCKLHSTHITRDFFPVYYCCLLVGCPLCTCRFSIKYAIKQVYADVNNTILVPNLICHWLSFFLFFHFVTVSRIDFPRTIVLHE